MKYCGFACLSLIVVGAVAHADEFAFFRYDDDFTYLSDPSKRVSWYDEIKYIPLGEDASHYLSIGGDLRERVESYLDGYFGLADAPHTTYLLSRALLDADLHLEDWFELKFGEGLIVSPRDGPNIRQAWDGGWVLYTVPGLRVDVRRALIRSHRRF